MINFNTIATIAKKLVAIRLSILVTVLLLSANSAAFAATPSVSVADGSGEAKVVKAQVVIDAPATQVWQTITNYNNMASYMPGYKKSRVTGGAGSNKTLDIGVKVSALLPTYNYKVRVTENKSAYTVKIQRTSGDFKAINANYKLIPQGNKTLLVYSLNIDLGDNVPNIGVKKTLKNNALKSMAAVQNKCVKEYKKNVVAAK